MSRRSLGSCALALVLALPGSPALAVERADIPPKYKWNLADLYPSEQAWSEARAEAQRRIAALSAHRGHLGDSAEALRKALDALFGVDREVQRILSYATGLSDQDTREAKPRELRQAAERLTVDLDAASSWLRPEILSLDPAKVRGFLAQDRGLEPYRFFLEDVIRWKPHTRPDAEEHLLAEAGNITDTGGNVFGILKDADLPYPTVRLSTGAKVRMDQAAFELHRASRVRQDRDKAFDTFLGALRGFQRTAGTTLYATVKAHLFTSKARHFGSALEAALFRDNIPTSVYRQLVADVRRTLPTFHRYLNLRRKMLGLDVLRYQDLYVPMVPKVDLAYSPEEARAVTLQSVAPLGQPYVEALRGGFEQGWTDYLPSTGKRSGAYSMNSGVYGVHPFQLLNFNGKYEDLSTLAHEAGHSMHTWLSMTSQPYPTYVYPTFVAEVASTLNENLLSHDLLKRARDDATRLFLLGTQLDRLRSTLFRQTQFAEFELAIHELAERGETLTAENMSARYLALAREYYGHDQGVCRVDDSIATEWAYVNHFYYDFYVYQYATSMVAATALAKAIREEEPRHETTRRDAYLAMLRAGGSRYPIDLLREAGVDMTASAPFDAAIAEMNGIMDEMERVLARRGTARPAR
jgi:oligoendopeptidase F